MVTAPGRGAQFRLTLPAHSGDRLVSSPIRLVPDDVTLTPRSIQRAVAAAIAASGELPLSIVPSAASAGATPSQPAAEGDGTRAVDAPAVLAKKAPADD